MQRVTDETLKGTPRYDLTRPPVASWCRMQVGGRRVLPSHASGVSHVRLAGEYSPATQTHTHAHAHFIFLILLAAKECSPATRLLVLVLHFAGEYSPAMQHGVSVDVGILDGWIYSLATPITPAPHPLPLFARRKMLPTWSILVGSSAVNFT